MEPPRTRFGPTSAGRVWLSLAGISIAFAGGHGFAAEIADPGQGAFDLPRGRSRATGLSGITHVGAGRYLAISDRRAMLFSLEIHLEGPSGRIASASIEPLAGLATARDVEGIARSAAGLVWVCDEFGPAVREHRVDDGSVVRQLAIPSVFANARGNLSLEGLSIDPDAATLWFANEEALRSDGAKSTAELGTWIRLQRFAAAAADAGSWVPDGQWAYRTDPIPGEALGGFGRSGVVDIVALSGSRVLTLERGVGTAGIRSRIYEVDLAGATDVSDRPGLVSGGFAPVHKRLLWEGRELGDNFEGIAVGPELGGGERSLILLSDDGGVTRSRLYALRIRLQD